MIRSYFFIPANNLRFIEKRHDLEADHYIFDLEDALAKDDQKQAILHLLELKDLPDHYVRIPNVDFLGTPAWKTLEDAGLRKIVIPKVTGLSELAPLNALEASLSVILLVEHPRLLTTLHEVIQTYDKQIHAVGLGSHDYAAITHMQHAEPYLKYAKDVVFTVGKAYNKEVIDGASMNVGDKKAFDAELDLAYKGGYDAKFFIHPLQLQRLHEFMFFSDEELAFAKKAVEIVGDQSDFRPFTLEGKVIEKPHLPTFRRMIEWSNK